MTHPSTKCKAHISIATPTTPAIKQSISFTRLPVLTATPVCTPGAVVAVRVPKATPASPVGVALSSSAGTTVTAVTVDLLPSGKVVVRTTRLDLEAGLLTTEAPEETVDLESEAELESEAVADGDGVTVPTVVPSPLTVVTTTTPAESVKVNTEPAERDGESVEDAKEGTSEVASGADSAPVEVMLAGRVAKSGVAVDSVMGVEAPLSLVRSSGIGSDVTVAASVASVLEAGGVADSTLGVAVSGTALVKVPFTFS